MGLKCRLLGHTYGEPEVERNREEQGDEVVVTIREIQACERCGDEQIVSQNKEVTAIRSPEEVGLDEGPADGSEPTDATPDATPDAGASGGAGRTEEGEQPTVSPAESRATPAEGTAEQTGTDSDAAPGANADHDATAEPASADVQGGGGDSSGTAAPEAAGADPEPAAAAEPASDGTAEGAAGATEDAGVIDEAETGGAGDGWETGSDDWEDVDADGDDGVILDDAETERDQTQWPEETDADPQRAARESAAQEGDGTESGSEEEVTNDAEIIDADEGTAAASASADAGATPTEDTRGHGEWAGRDADAASNGWPDHDGDDEGYAASPGGDADVEFESGGGLTPEVNGHAEPDDAETIEGIAPGTDGADVPAAADESEARPEAVHEADEGFARAGESTTLESDVPDDRVEFYCPNCGYARVAGASSMRAGDICPECKQGYIAERER